MKPKLSDQMWSWIYVITGGVMVLIFRHFGIDTGIAAGVIGGGLQSYSASLKGKSDAIQQ